MRVAIVGAGISGLVNAYEAMMRGHDVVVLDRADRAGGNIRTIREDGYTVEMYENLLIMAHDDEAEFVTAADARHEF